MRLFPLDNSVERALLMRPSKVYPRDLVFLRKAVGRVPILIDVGANIGAMSLPLARMPGVQIIAVDAGPVALSRLRFNVAANQLGNFRIDGSALSDTNSTISFFANSRDLKLSGIGAKDVAGETINVQCKTMTALLSEHEITQPFVLKIDVEFHEDKVLMPFFSSTPQERWPAHVLIEAMEKEALPQCVQFMLANSYRKTFATRQNTGLSRVGFEL